MRYRIPLMGYLALVIVALFGATCTPRAQHQDGPWKFEDNFSSQIGGWPTGTTDRGDEFSYVDGKYRILIKIKEGQVGAGQIAGIPFAGRRFHTLVVEADAVQQLGPPGALHGVICGTSPAELYFFLISLDGSYFIVRDDAGTASADLLGSGRLSVPIRGIGEANRIRAQCVGSEQEAMLTLSVNGEKVAEARGQRGESFDRAGFTVTTLYAIAGSTRTAVPGVSKERPGSPAAFEVEVLFDNFVARNFVARDPQSDPLKLLTRCEFPDGLRVVSADRLPAEARLREVVTTEGRKSVSLADGYRVMLAYPGSGYFANMKIERFEASRYPDDKSAIIQNLQYLSDQSLMEAGVRVPLEHYEYHGFDLYAVNFPTIDFYITNNLPALGGGPISTYVLFEDSTRSVFTVYFVNQRPERRNFQSIEEYRTLRDRFLEEYTSCVIRSAR